MTKDEALKIIKLLRQDIKNIILNAATDDMDMLEKMLERADELNAFIKSLD